MGFIFQKFVDRFVGFLLIQLLYLKPRNFLSKNPKNVCVVKLWALGESVQTLPMISALRENFPSAKISVLCRKRNKSVYDGQLFVDEILLFEDFWYRLPFNKFDLVFDAEPYLNVSALVSRWIGRFCFGFSHGVRAKLYDERVFFDDKKNEVLVFMNLLKSLRIKNIPTKLCELIFDSDDAKHAEFLVGGSRVFRVGLCAGVAESGLSRMWPAERYAELADRLVIEMGASVFFVGTKGEHDLVESIRFLCKEKEVYNLAGRTTPRQLFALMKQFSVFVSNDTGPMHVAAAQGVKTVGIFGPNLPVRNWPFGKGNVAIYNKVECSPCINVHKGEVPECFNVVKGKCMKQIEVNAVFKEVSH